MISDKNYPQGVPMKAGQLLAAADRAYDNGQVRHPWHYVINHIDNTDPNVAEIEDYIRECLSFRAMCAG